MKNIFSFLGAFFAVTVLAFALAADTPRGQSDVLALFPDNTAGSISAQDLRDFVVSRPRGDIRTDKGNTGGQTTNASAGTFDVITQWDEDGVCGAGLTCANASDTITTDFTGTATVSASMSFSGTANSTFTVKAYVNDVATTCEFSRKLSAGGDVGRAALGPCEQAISATDHVDVRVASDGTSDSFVVESGSLHVAMH